MPVANLSADATRFLESFGPKEEIYNELKQFWEKEKNFISPRNLYSHLCDKRVEEGKISREFADALKQRFNKTFEPEQVTGYYPKHRIPVISTLHELYLDIHPDRHLFRAEGDIKNLGSLNKAMLRSAKTLQSREPDKFAKLAQELGIDPQSDNSARRVGRLMADRLLRTFSDTIYKGLETDWHIIPIRKGGDELAYFVEPKGQWLPTLSPTQALIMLVREFGAAQEDIAALVESAGLRTLPHHKAGQVSGVGVGLSAVHTMIIKPEEQQKWLDRTIKIAKDKYDDQLHIGRSTIGTRRHSLVKRVKELIDGGEISNLTRASAQHAPAPALDTDVGPAEAWARHLHRGLEATKGAKLNSDEERLLDHSVTLLAKRDYVTGTPLFADMEHELLPHFLQKYGAQHGGAKFVHADFSNMAGGNEIASDVGDAMGGTFAGVVRKAMAETGLREFEDYLTSQPGGKFAFPVPADTSRETLRKLEEALKTALAEASGRPLALAPEVKQELLNFRSQPLLQHKYGPSGGRLLENGDVVMSNIINPKTGLKGSDVFMTASAQPVDTQRPLGPQMSGLEKGAERQYMAQVRKRLNNNESVYTPLSQQPPGKAR